ncbi:MAG TPA: hypothetical protein VI876_02880 [Dehalococcoidia bacterium]|nr:hypothetical protein [Dehalococcoidia bacterium]
MMRLACARLRIVTFLLLGSLACASSACSILGASSERPGPAPARPTSPELTASTSVSTKTRDDLFSRLTASRWCNKHYIDQKAQLAETSKSYEFAADGVYDWFHESDYLEGEGGGTWTFIATDADSGIIFLDSGDALRFSLVDDGPLLLEFEPLDACEALTVEGQPNELPRIKPSALFQQITAHTWYRSSDTDLRTRPTSITYVANGTYLADYRFGDCREAGSWSLRDGQVTRQLPLQRCDLRESSSNATRLRYAAAFHDGRLVTENAAFAKEPLRPNGTATLYAERHGQYEAIVDYQMPLRVGVANTFVFRLKNVGVDWLTLLDATVEATPYSQTPEGYTAAGPAGLIAATAALNITIAPGESYEFSLDFTPEGAGETGFDIEVKVQGKRQRFDSRFTPVVDLGAP